MTDDELLIRDAAAEWLRRELRWSSDATTGGTWADDWEYHSWLAKHPDSDEWFAEDREAWAGEMLKLRRLGEALGGWWIQTGNGSLTWEPMDTWLVMVAEWQAEHGKDGGL